MGVNWRQIAQLWYHYFCFHVTHIIHASSSTNIQAMVMKFNGNDIQSVSRLLFIKHTQSKEIEISSLSI